MTDYDAYLEAQREKTRQTPRLQHPRVAYLAYQLKRLVPTIAGTALCVGCRNAYELEMFRALGLDALGIDLVTTHSSIYEMDMHALQFAYQFEVVVGSHVLEHAYDLPQVLREWARVTKPGGYWVIEMPVNFTPTPSDRVGVGSLAGLRPYVQPYLAKVLWATESAHIIRLIGHTHG